MARARVYTVYIRAWSLAADREAVFVREGFSWGAFFFSVLWSLYHRLWLAAFLVFAASVALSVATDVLGVDPVTDAALGLALALIVGWEANDWRRRALERRGYVAAGIVAAPTLTEAERRFFAKSAAPAASGPWRPSLA